MVMVPITVLITGCSKHSKGIIDCLKNNEDNRPVRVIGVDCNVHNLLRNGVDNAYVVPKITDPEYFEKLLDICKYENVDVIMPYITAELPLIAEKIEMFEANGVKVSVSSKESLAIANDKIELSKVASTFMPTQTVVENADDVRDFAKYIGYPHRKFCCKLSSKCGGAGFAIVDDKKAYDLSLFNKIGVNRYISLDELVKIVEKNDCEVILQEYIEGLDYSVTVLADKGEVKYMCGFVGYSMVYGAVTSGEIVENKEAYIITSHLCKKLKLDGNACFDFIITKSGSAKLLEINPRINASLPFVAAAGLNLPYLRCKQLVNEEINKDYAINYGLKMNKYYESEYFI